MLTDESNTITNKFTFNQCPIILARKLNTAKVRSILFETKCYLDVQSRVLNRRHRATPWTKGSIVEVVGPTAAAIEHCNDMIESVLPFYKDRRPYTESESSWNQKTLEDNVNRKNHLASTSQLNKRDVVKNACADASRGKLTITHRTFNQSRGQSFRHDSITHLYNATKRVASVPIWLGSNVSEPSGDINSSNRNEHNVTNQFGSARVVSFVREPKTPSSGRAVVNQRNALQRSSHQLVQNRVVANDSKSHGEVKRWSISQVGSRTPVHNLKGDDRPRSSSHVCKTQMERADSRTAKVSSSCSGKFQTEKKPTRVRTTKRKLGSSRQIQHTELCEEQSCKVSESAKVDNLVTVRSQVGKLLPTESSIGPNNVLETKNLIDSKYVQVLDAVDPRVYYACTAGQSITSDETLSTLPTTILTPGNYRLGPEQPRNGTKSELPECSYGTWSVSDKRIKYGHDNETRGERSPLCSHSGGSVLNSQVSPMATPESNRSLKPAVRGQAMSKWNSDVDLRNHSKQVFNVSSGSVKATTTLIPTILIQQAPKSRCGDREQSPVSFHQPFSTKLMPQHAISLVNCSSDIGYTCEIPADDTVHSDQEYRTSKTGRRAAKRLPLKEGRRVKSIRSKERVVARTPTHGNSDRNEPPVDTQTNRPREAPRIAPRKPRMAKSNAVIRISQSKMQDEINEAGEHEDAKPLSVNQVDEEKKQSQPESPRVRLASNGRTKETNTTNGRIKSPTPKAPNRKQSERSNVTYVGQNNVPAHMAEKKPEAKLEPVRAKRTLTITAGAAHSTESTLQQDLISVEGDSVPSKTSNGKFSALSQDSQTGKEVSRTKLVPDECYESKSKDSKLDKNQRRGLHSVNKYHSPTYRSQSVDHCGTNLPSQETTTFTKAREVKYPRLRIAQEMKFQQDSEKYSERDRASMTPSRLPRPTTTSATFIKAEGSREVMSRSISEASDGNGISEVRMQVKSPNPSNEPQRCSRTATNTAPNKSPSPRPPSIIVMGKRIDLNSSDTSSTSSDIVTSSISDLSDDESEVEANDVIPKGRSRSSIPFSGKRGILNDKGITKTPVAIRNFKLRLHKPSPPASESTSGDRTDPDWRNLKKLYQEKLKKFIRLMWLCMPWLDHQARKSEHS